MASEEASTAILASVFGDPEALGLASLWCGTNKTKLDTDDTTIGHLIKTSQKLGFHNSSTKQTEQFQKAMERYEYNPLRILAYFNGEVSVPYAPYTFTPFVFSKRARASASASPNTVWVSDSHIHGGLAGNPRFLLREIAYKKGIFSDSDLDGKSLKKPFSYDIALLCASLRWALWLVDEFLANNSWKIPSALHDSNNTQFPCGIKFWNLIESGGFWALVKAACLDRDVDATRQLQAINAFFGHGVQLKRQEVVIEDVLKNCLKSKTHLASVWDSDTNLTSWQYCFLMGIVRATVSLFCGCMASPDDNLESFGEKVRFASKLRNVVLGTKPKKYVDYYLDSISSIVSSYSEPFACSGLELRLKATGDTGTNLNTLASAWTAYQQYVSGGELPIRFSVPLVFSREKQLAEDRKPCQQAPGIDFQKAVSIARSLMHLSSVVGESAKSLLVSTDVVGTETLSSNWPFCSIANWLKTQLGGNLCLTYHAGESFSSEIKGIRMIGELFLGDHPPDRIGHALALDSHFSATIEKRYGLYQRYRTKRDFLMDICWLTATGILPVQESDDLISCLTKTDNTQTQIPPQDWIQAFKLLHNAEIVDYLTHGLPLSYEIGTESCQSQIEINADIWRFSRDFWSDGTIHEAAMQLAWNEPVDPEWDCKLGAIPSEEFAGHITTIVGSYYWDARKYVSSKILEHGVVIETCPTSNLCLAGMKSASGYTNHPVWGFIASGIAVSVNSDDPLVFLNYGGDEINALQHNNREPRILSLSLQDSNNSAHSIQEFISVEKASEIVTAITNAMRPAGAEALARLAGLS